MTLEKSKSLGYGGNGFQGDGPGSAAKMLKELQGFKMVVVTGVAADTDMAVAGIKTTDTITAACMFSGGVPSDVTADVSITSAGNIQYTGDSSGNTLQVFYWVKP